MRLAADKRYNSATLVPTTSTAACHANHLGDILHAIRSPAMERRDYPIPTPYHAACFYKNYKKVYVSLTLQPLPPLPLPRERRLVATPRHFVKIPRRLVDPSTAFRSASLPLSIDYCPRKYTKKRPLSRRYGIGALWPAVAVPRQAFGLIYDAHPPFVTANLMPHLPNERLMAKELKTSTTGTSRVDTASPNEYIPIPQNLPHSLLS